MRGKHEDWTDLEHDRQLHDELALSQTGYRKGCPRCEALFEGKPVINEPHPGMKFSCT